MTNICKAIDCPNNTRSGCNRYSVSAMCHLSNKEFDFRNSPDTKHRAYHNQYWIFLADATPEEVAQLKERNESGS